MLTLFTAEGENLIRQGIEQGKGQPEDLKLVQSEWLINLGKRAADLGVRQRTGFFSRVVTPVNNIEEGIRDGHYNDHYKHISPATVPLKMVTTPKRVYLVPVIRTVPQDGIPIYLGEYGLKPCIDAPNYLLGLMKQVPESEMPEDLKNKLLGAAEPNVPSSVFRSKGGSSCFLCVHRREGKRRLSMTRVAGEWGTDWVLLAELLDS